MKKGVKILLWVVGVVLALLLLVSLVAGPVAKGYINKHGEQLIGRRISVEHVGVNLFSGNVTVRDLSVYEDDGDTRFAGFDTLDVSARLLALPFKTLHIGHITLAGFDANIEQDGDRFNFSSLLEHFAADSTAEKDTTPSDWTLKFYNIRINHASLSYDDLKHHKGIHLPDINLRVPGFVLGGGEDSEGGLNLGFDKGGRLNIDANLDDKQHGFDLAVNLEGFKIENLDSYLTDMLDYSSLDGTVEMHLSATGKTDDIMKSRIGGTVSVRGLDLRDRDAKVLGLDSLSVNIDNINIDENIFDVKSVRLSGLTATYEQWKDYSNLSRMLVSDDEPQAVTLQTGLGMPEDSVKTVEEEPRTPSKPMRLRVGSLLVENCAVTYNDHSLPDEFHFPVTNIKIEAHDLSTNGDNNAQLRASLPGGGHLMLRWRGNIDNWKQYQDIFLTVKGLDMKQLSPWTVAYTGQPVEDGIFGLTTRVGIVNSQLDNQNKIDIYKARVGDRRKDVEPEMKIPLKTALYILKDKDDKILIDMPISGNVDSPEFNYMKLVWKTLGNLLVKVATSPARALGNALGMNGENLEFMAVDPHQFSLTSEQYHTLADLATIAATDSLIVITLEQRMPEAASDTATRRYEMMNRQIETYMQEQGLGADRLRITTSTVANGEKTGYAIGSEMKIEE